MAVQFADKALYQWLLLKIEEIDSQTDEFDDFRRGYIEGLRDTRDQLKAFWGSALETKT